MKKFIRLLSASMAAFVLVSTINAEEIKDIFQLVFEGYNENSPSFKSIELQHEQSKLDDYSNLYSLKAAEAALEDNENQIKSLENQLFLSYSSDEKKSLRSSIEYRQIYRFELELNKVAAELETEIDSINAEFSEYLLDSEKKSCEYKLRSKVSELITLKKQLEYLDLQEKYYIQNVEITKSSLEIGYSTQLDLENAEAELSAAHAEVLECALLIAQCEKEISLNSGNAISEMNYEFMDKCDDKENSLLNRFKEYLYQDEIYEKQAQAYSVLMEKTEEIHGRLKFFNATISTDNTEYKERLCERFDGIAAYYGNKLETVENDKKKYEIALEMYVLELEGRYEVCLADISAAEAALRAAETNVSVIGAFYKEGHVRELDTIEAHAMLIKAEYELISAQAKLDSVIFAINNNVIML